MANTIYAKESAYQSKLISKLEELFPGCLVIKNDPSTMQGIPDLLILSGEHWAMLEVKLEPTSSRQPNQEYYVEHFGTMGFASFISPENEEQVLNDLQQALRTCR